MVTDQQIEADAVRFTDERRDFWHQTGSVNERGEFKQFLHVWSMRNKGPGPMHISHHESFQWVALWNKPDVLDLSAYWHMTDFKLFPNLWDHFWDHIAVGRGLSISCASIGPFWMLLPHSSDAALAQQMTGMKRRIQNQQFLRNKTQAISAVDAELVFALAPFRVLTPQQEFEDEAARSSEIRRNNVPYRNLPTLGRPPRCG